MKKYKRTHSKIAKRAAAICMSALMGMTTCSSALPVSADAEMENAAEQNADLHENKGSSINSSTQHADGTVDSHIVRRDGIKQNNVSHDAVSHDTDSRNDDSGNVHRDGHADSSVSNTETDSTRNGQTDNAENSTVTGSDQKKDAYRDAATAKDGDREVVVEASADAGVLPDDAKLSVRTLSAGSREYASAKSKAEDEIQKSGKTVSGMLAYDIAFLQNGKEVEPDGSVHIKIHWKKNDGTTVAAPRSSENTSDSSSGEISILHIEDNDNREQVKDLTASSEKENRADVNVNEDKTLSDASITVDSFSVFTIVWKTDDAGQPDDGNGQSTQIASVKIHYVDAKGRDLREPENADTLFSARQKGEEVSLSDLGTDNGQSRIAGYTYTEGKIGGTFQNASKAEKVRADKVSGESSYHLEYAQNNSKGNDSWTAVPSEGNTANIYLVYAKNIAVHFVSPGGNSIWNGKYDASDDLSRYENGQVVDLYADYTNNGSKVLEGYQPFSGASWNDGQAAHSQILAERANGENEAGGHTGTYVRYLKYEYAHDPGTEDTGNGTVYASADQKTWFPLSGTPSVYIVYVPYHVTVHYVDEAGRTIREDAVKDTAALFSSKASTDPSPAKDAATGDISSTSSVSPVSDISAIADAVPGYSFVKAGTDRNGVSTVKSIKATVYAAAASGSDFEYQSSDASVWSSLPNNELYLIYKPTNIRRKVTIHYVDLAGEPITDQSGNPITIEDDAAAWGRADYTKPDRNGIWYNDLGMYMRTFDGYLPFNENQVNNGSRNDNASQKSVYSTGNSMKYSPAVSGTETRGAVKDARNFRFMRYNASDNALYIGRGRKTDANVSAGEKLNGDTDIYLFYQCVLTIHYVDTDGKELYPSSTTYTSNGSTGSYIIPYFWQDYDGYTLTSAASQSGHGNPIAIYDENVTSTDKHEIKKIEWKYDDNDEKWATRLTLNDDSTEVKDKLISDIYMVYPKTGTTAFTGVIHHVDQNGTKLKEDTSYTISTSVTDSGTGYTDQWNGYSSLAQGIFGFDTGLGDYTGAYIGSFGDKACWTTHGVLYKYDSASSTWHTAKGTTGSEPDAKTELTDEQGSPVLYKEIWIVYQKAGAKDVTVHHVDDEGKTLHEDTTVQVSNSFVLKPDEAAAAIPGYVLKEARIGSGMAGEVFTKGSYSYTNRTWKNGFINGNTILNTDSPVNEITLVYRSLNKFIVHYIDTDGNTMKGDTSFILSDGEIKDLDGREFTEDIVNGTDTYNHVKTYIRSDTADMNVSRVTVKALNHDETEKDQITKGQTSKGQSIEVIYMRKADLLEPDGVMVKADAKDRHAPKNTWTASTAAGRVFTLRKSGSDYTLTDTGTDAGATGMNLKKTETKDGIMTQTFVSSGIDNDHFISYTVTASASADDAEHMIYKLSVDESTENNQTDIYEVFSRKQDGGRLILHNDLADSGNLIVEGDTTLKDILDNKDISNIQYTWHNYRMTTFDKCRHFAKGNRIQRFEDDCIISKNAARRKNIMWHVAAVYCYETIIFTERLRTLHMATSFYLLDTQKAKEYSELQQWWNDEKKKLRQSIMQHCTEINGSLTNEGLGIEIASCDIFPDEIPVSWNKVQSPLGQIKINEKGERCFQWEPKYVWISGYIKSLLEYSEYCKLGDNLAIVEEILRRNPQTYLVKGSDCEKIKFEDFRKIFTGE